MINKYTSYIITQVRESILVYTKLCKVSINMTWTYVHTEEYIDKKSLPETALNADNTVARADFRYFR